MDDQMTYEKASVVDYGSLEELTAGCIGATGGDAIIPTGHLGEFTFGKEIHTSAIQCTSK